MHGLVQDLGISILFASIVGFLIHKTRQPSILAYLIVGVIIGPEIGPALISDVQNIETISEIGLILLLFIIGLEMHPRHLVSIFRKVYISGIGQFTISMALSMATFAFLGYAMKEGNLEILYLALGCSLSSTAIVIKLLYDKFEIDTYAGKLSIGILLIQDIWAIFILALQPNLNNPQALPILMAVGKTILLVSVAFLVSRFLLKKAFESVSKSPEMVVTLSIGWCTLIATIATFLGLSVEMGALIAGVAIASFPYSMHVTAKISPLRDFFLILFFISLGMKIPFPETRFIGPVLIVIALTFITRFASVLPLGMAAGSSLRNSFIASLNLSQVGEFSLVIAAIGVSLGHISKDTLAVILYAMSITAVVSAYAIKFNYPIFRFVEKITGGSRRSHSTNRENDSSSGDSLHGNDHSIIILGYHRGAQALVELLSRHNPSLLKEICVIDFNLETIRQLKASRIACCYGDISSIDTLESAGISRSKVIVSTIPDLLLKGTSNFHLVETCRRLNHEAFIIATADLGSQIEPLKKAGANQVILPYSEAAHQLLQILSGLSLESKRTDLTPEKVLAPA